MSRRALVATLTSAAAVALVTGAVYALEPVAPVLSLGVLYLLAVLPVAAVWGLPFATAVSVVSMLAFNWLFLPPRHTFHLADSENWVALAVYLGTAVSVSGLAARVRRRAAEAEQQRREAAFAAQVSALLLEGPAVEPLLPQIAVLAADLLGVSHCWIELGPPRDPDPDEVAVQLRAANREIGYVFLDGRPHPDVEDRVVSVLASLLATGIEREELTRSDAEKTAVLRSVSHDLRSPLTAISTASELLAAANGALSPAEREELVASIFAQARRLDRLVANLLDLSRLEAGAATPVLEVWTVDGLIARALEAIGPESERVRVTLSTDSPAVRVDATQLEHALVNLLENALRFSSPTDVVEMGSSTSEGEATIRVCDHGPGIPAADLQSIFEPFRQGAGTTGRGSGLGLAIARGFAHLNDGHLWVESTPGAGATFSLSLPTVQVPVGA